MSSLTTYNSLVHNLGVKPQIDRTLFGGSKNGSKGGSKGKHSIALTALTLLAFLFFLNILQNCLDEHMESMTPQQVVVMSAPAQYKQIEAENRKGETEDVNTTLPPESKEEEYAQIPVKLKTV